MLDWFFTWPGELIDMSDVRFPGRWVVPPRRVTLDGEEIHVWRILLADAPPDADVRSVLSAEELARAERFVRAHERNAFATARFALRSILARYVNARAGQLDFSYNRQGKPELAGAFADCGVRFNLAHSRGMALLAVAADRAVGVDVEALRKLDTGSIARYYLPASEWRALESVPPDAQMRAFFRLWTRKEALVKALGWGLAAIGQFELTPLGRSRRVWRLHDTGPIAGPQGDWTVGEVGAGAGYVGAVAVEGNWPPLRRFQFPPGGVYSRSV